MCPNFVATPRRNKRHFSREIENEGGHCESPFKRQRVKLKNNKKTNEMKSKLKSQKVQLKNGKKRKEMKQKMLMELENDVFDELKRHFPNNTINVNQEVEDQDFGVDNDNNNDCDNDSPRAIKGRISRMRNGSDDNYVKSGNDVGARIERMLSRNVFEINETLTIILKFLDIKKLIVFRRINTRFYNLLNFCFSGDDCQLYFNYNSKFARTMIEKKLCSNNDISMLAKWYLQTINLQRRCIMVKVQPYSDDNQDNNKNNNKDLIMNDKCNCDSKSVEKTNKYDLSYLKSVELCKMDICDENGVFKRNKSKKLDENIDKNGNSADCKVLKRIYYQFKCINKQIQDGKKLSHRMINDLLLGYIFEIKLFKDKLLLLLLQNNHFRNGLCFDWCAQTHAFINVTRQLGMHPPLLAQDFTVKNYTIGHFKQGFQAFLSYTALKGDFAVYNNFLKDVFNNDESKIVRSGRILDGIFSLGCLFLRHDIIDNYVHYNTIHDGLLEDTICCLLYLLNPDFLAQYKTYAKNIVGIPLNDKEIFEMDIINNNRYCPYNRLSLIKKLCFSSVFGLSLSRNISLAKCEKRYEELRKIVDKLYYDFDFFQNKWHLKEYRNFEKNLEKQKKLHEDFQIIIQTLFGFGFWFQDRTREYQVQSIIKSTMNSKNNRRRNVLNVLIDKYKFIDIKIKTERQLRQYYNIITQGDDNQTVCRILENPVSDGRFCAISWVNTGGNDQRLIFRQVLDAYAFIHSMWKTNCTHHDNI